MDKMKKCSSSEPVLSVCVVAYNHEKFIRQCLESIVAQEATFNFEIIVGDDCSTDSTRRIVEEFQSKYPDKFRLLLHPKNVGATKNYFAVHNHARGKYIAHCDGDDYWLPGKLMHQYRLLEDNKNLAYVGETAQKISGRMLLNANDLLKMRNPVIHSSKMYRREAMITRNSDVDLLDFFLNVEHVHYGKAALEPVTYTVYRPNVGVLKRMGLQFYRLNCQAAYRAYELGADKALAYGAARGARFTLIKQAVHHGEWDKLDVLLRPAKLESMMATGYERNFIETLLKFRLFRYIAHFLMRTKRATLSNK